MVEERAARRRAGAVARAGLELHDGADLLSPLGMRDADDAAVGDGRMLRERGLDLCGVDVDAARDDHVGAAVAEGEVAVGVEEADVAEREELAAAALRRLSGIALVLEGRAGAEVEVAGGTGRAGPAVRVEDVHLEARPGPPDGARVREPLLGGDPDAAALRAAVELVEHGAEPLDHSPLHVDGDRRGAVHDEPQAREVVRAPHRLGQAQEAHEVRRHQEGRDHALALDGAQQLLRVEAVLEHDVGAEQHRAFAVGVGPRVVERRRDEVGAAGELARGAPQHRDARGSGGARRRLCRARGPQHSLRAPGRARRVQECVARERVGERRAVVLRGLLEASEALDLAADREARARRHARAGRERGLGEAGVGDEGARLAVVDDVAHLVGLPVPADRRPAPPRPRGASVGEEHLRRVREQRRDAAARGHAGRVEGAREAIALGEDPRVGDAADHATPRVDRPRAGAYRAPALYTGRSRWTSCCATSPRRACSR